RAPSRASVFARASPPLSRAMPGYLSRSPAAPGGGRAPPPLDSLLRAGESAGVEGAPRRTLVAWALYDFANSAFVAVVPATVYSKYYALRVVGNERGAGDFWWGLSVTVSMLLVAAASPPLGALADHAGVRKRCLAGLTYASVAATALMATVGRGDVLWGFALAVAATVGFEAAIVFYNAY